MYVRWLSVSRLPAPRSSCSCWRHSDRAVTAPSTRDDVAEISRRWSKSAWPGVKGAELVRNRRADGAERLISRRVLWHKQLMSQSKPILQKYGPLHALSSRGLHVRESARSWKLVVPMSAELLEAVRSLCDRVEPAQAARLLLLLERSMQRAAALPALVEASLVAGNADSQESAAGETHKPTSWFEFVVRCVGVDLVARDVGHPPISCN